MKLNIQELQNLLRALEGQRVNQAQKEALHARIKNELANMVNEIQI